MSVPLFSRLTPRQPLAVSRWRPASFGGALCGLVALASLCWKLAPAPGGDGQVVLKARTSVWPPAEVPGARADDMPAPQPAISSTAVLPRPGAVAAPAVDGNEAWLVDSDPLQLNRDIPVQMLTPSRPMAAQSFLRHVVLKADARGGYVVRHVAAGSAWARMGLQAGDRIYSLDTPAMAAVDESSMVALIQARVLELDIVRNGMPMRLSAALNEDAAADDGSR